MDKTKLRWKKLSATKNFAGFLFRQLFLGLRFRRKKTKKLVEKPELFSKCRAQFCSFLFHLSPSRIPAKIPRIFDSKTESRQKQKKCSKLNPTKIFVKKKSKTNRSKTIWFFCALEFPWSIAGKENWVLKTDYLILFWLFFVPCFVSWDWFDWVKKSIKNYSIKLPLLYFEKQILAPTCVIVIIFDFHCKPNPTGKKKIFPKWFEKFQEFRGKIFSRKKTMRRKTIINHKQIWT